MVNWFFCSIFWTGQGFGVLFRFVFLEPLFSPDTENDILGWMDGWLVGLFWEVHMCDVSCGFLISVKSLIFLSSFFTLLCQRVYPLSSYIIPSQRHSFTIAIAEIGHISHIFSNFHPYCGTFCFLRMILLLHISCFVQVCSNMKSRNSSVGVWYLFFYL